MSKRFKDAHYIIQGAVNPVAVTRSLNEAVQEAWQETNDMDKIRLDPAVRLIAYQLAHILRLHRYEDFAKKEFENDLEAVKEKANG